MELEVIFCNANPRLCVFDIMLDNTLVACVLKTFCVLAIGTSFVKYFKVFKMAKFWGVT